MRWFFNVAKAVLLLALLLSAIGLWLPAQRQVERSRELAAPVSMIWPWLVEPRRWQAWSPWVARDPAMTLRYSGPASGVGAEWSWDSRTLGHGQARLVEAQPPLLRFEMLFDGLVAVSSLELTPLGANATRVVWRIDADLGYNPVARWFGLMLDRMVGPDLDEGLARLASQVGPSAATPPRLRPSPS